MKTKVINLISWILVSLILIGIILIWNSKALGQEWTSEQKEVWEAVEAKWKAIEILSQAFQLQFDHLLLNKHDH
jgi:hypothetical protein